MLFSPWKVIGMVFVVAAAAAAPGSALAAPLPTGACCNQVLGCCPPEGVCSVGPLEECNGFADTYKGDGTTCEEQCPITTTTFTTTTTTSTTTTSSTATSSSTTTTTLPLVVICGDANFDEQITSTDALIALRTAVGTSSCNVEVCDYNGSGEVTSPDALLILRVAVGQVVVPMCPVII